MFQFHANLGEGGFQGFARQAQAAAAPPDSSAKVKNWAAVGVALLLLMALLSPAAVPTNLTGIAEWKRADVAAWATGAGCIGLLDVNAGHELAALDDAVFLAQCKGEEGTAAARFDELKEAFGDQLIGATPAGDFWVLLESSAGALMLLLCVALPWPRLSFLYLHAFHHVTWIAPLLSGGAGELPSAAHWLCMGLAPHARVAWLLNGTLRAANPVVVCCAQFLLLQQTAREFELAFAPGGWVTHVMGSPSVYMAGAQTVLYNVVFSYCVPGFALRWYVQYKLLLGPGLELTRSLYRVATGKLAEKAPSDRPTHRAGRGDDKVD